MKDASPVYITVSQVQKALGWEGRNGYWRTFRWLKKSHVLVKRGGRWVTTRDLLLTEMPEIWNRLAENAVEYTG